MTRYLIPEYQPWQFFPERLFKGRRYRRNVLVGTDTGGFKSFGGKLFVFVRNHVDAEREFIDVGALATEIEDTDFGVWNTTVEAGLGVWLWRKAG